MNRFSGYLVAVGLAALAMGIQVVMVPWLAVGELHLEPSHVGWVQSAGLLPVVLMLYGGSFADRAGAWRWLPLIYGAMALCHAGLLAFLVSGHLALLSLLSYALLLGVCQAFLQPLRDRVLPRFHQRSRPYQGAVVRISLSVYVAQALGVLLAGQSERLGLAPIFAVQVVALLACALLFVLLLRHSERDVPVPVQTPAAVSVAEGLGFVRHHPVLRHLMLLVSFNGFMNMGVFVVAIPLLSRHVYQQDALSFSLLQLLFTFGGIAASVGLIRRGHVAQPGRAILFCLLYTGLLMLALSAQPKESGLLMLVFGWGVVAGVSASLGKGLLQQQVPEAYRGRTLSIYQLALFGSAPLGALVCGYVAQAWGPLTLFTIGGVLSLALFVVYLGVRPMWRLERALTVSPAEDGETPAGSP